jgi:hypothetical protein
MQCSKLEVHGLLAAGVLLAYFFTLKLEAERSSETLVNLYRTTWWYDKEEVFFNVTIVRT